MYIIISKDNRVPKDVEMFDYEHWSLDEFIEKASSEEGIEIGSSGGLYFNIDILTEPIYNAVRVYSENDVTIVYYQFEDQNVTLGFTMEDSIIIYNMDKPDKPEDIQEPQETIQESVEEDGQQLIENFGKIITNSDIFEENKNGLKTQAMSNLLNVDDFDVSKKHNTTPGKVIVFGSSKGGTGKTFTCLITAYRYAQTHPNKRVALADFDIIDGQIGITINKIAPTLADFYKYQKNGFDAFDYLDNCKVKNDHFSHNIDFYLAPPMDTEEITNDAEFWKKAFTLLITNYDVVFFDTGIDYLGKGPISKLYKIADKIIITCNPSINSVRSIIKQLKTLNGSRKNDKFAPEDKILSRVRIVMTRVYDDAEINSIVSTNIQQYAPIIAAFGNIDDIVSQVQWYQRWELIANNKVITNCLDNIADLS